MELKTETKTPSFISNERYEWPIHQPTSKVIQLPQNWFTSKESEHSPCNGHAKALQNAKIQLKNDPNLFLFLNKSFINFMSPPKVEFPSIGFLQLILVV